MRFALAFAVTLLVYPQAKSQTHVYPGENLQAAVDRTPHEGWVWIHGGVYEHVQVRDKSIALFASPSASIRTGEQDPHIDPSLFGSPGSGFTQKPSAIEVRGSGHEWFAVFGVRSMAGEFFGGYWNAGGRGLHAENLANLLVMQCSFSADRNSGIGGDVISSEPGIKLRNVTQSWLELTYARASNYFWGVKGRMPLLDSGPAVDAEGQSVHLRGCWLEGGDHFQNVWIWDDPNNPSSVAPSWGGYGGPGIIAGALSIDNALIFPGESATFYGRELANTNNFFLLGQQGPGSPIVIR